MLDCYAYRLFSRGENHWSISWIVTARIRGVARKAIFQPRQLLGSTAVKFYSTTLYGLDVNLGYACICIRLQWRTECVSSCTCWWWCCCCFAKLPTLSSRRTAQQHEYGRLPVSIDTTAVRSLWGEQMQLLYVHNQRYG